MQMRLGTVLFVLFAIVAPHVARATDGKIEWRLQNPFRLFLDPNDTQLHIDAYRSLDGEEKKAPVLSVERHLSKRFKEGWSEKMFDKTCWDDRKNGYRFCRDEGIDYINPREHKVVLRYDGNYTTSDRCEWRIFDPEDPRQKTGGDRKAVPCAEEVIFDVPYPTGAKISVSINGRVSAEQLVKVRDVFIVGVGDSFASGEGNPDVPVRLTDERSADYGLDPKKQPLRGYPTRAGQWSKIGDSGFLREAALWQSRACHRSLYSWQLRAALQLAVEDPQRAVTFVGFACSGSEITVGLFLKYLGNEWDRYPPQLPQLSYVSQELCGREESTPKDYTTGYTQLGKLPELQNMVLNKCYKPKRNIDLLFLSVGGNDVGFSRLVANAVLADQALLKTMGGWMGSVHGVGQAEALLSQLKIRYTALNKAFHYMLQIPWREADRIVLTAYPRMAFQADGVSYCSDGRDGMDLYPDFYAIGKRLAEDETFADSLYKNMKEAAAGSGWTFVDEHRQQFASHGFCARKGGGDVGVGEVLDLPRMKDGKWAPYRPSQFRAYESRQRWYRTPNDAFMIGNFHYMKPVSKRVLRNKRLKWFQIIMAGTYSGSFHPTAEGHAAIADAVVKKARQVLAKYSRRDEKKSAQR